jgi:thymidylate kinase
MDGAGKTTQIEALSSLLTQQGMRVRLIRFWDDVARCKRLRETSGRMIFKGDSGVGSPSAPINRRDKNVQSPFMTAVRLVIYFLDAISLRLTVEKVLTTGADFVIFDRYTYDELANLRLRNPIIRIYVRLLMKFVPRPHISFLLDADPIRARARKPEYPLAFLYINRQSYLDLGALIGGMAVIPPGPVEEVKREILRHVLNKAPIGDVGKKNHESRTERAGHLEGRSAI